MKKVTLHEQYFDEYMEQNILNIGENLEKIDKKHQEIVDNALSDLKKNKKKFIKTFRDWKFQGDFSCPAQISFLHLKVLGIFQFLRLIIKFFFQIKSRDFIRSFKDDLYLLSKVGAEKILEKNPVHKTPNCKSFYKINGSSTNYRWNRYIYFANTILKKKILNDGDIHVDIGSFYGGLQSILKKEFPKTNFVLIDFHHQLLRSYIFLKSLYPDSNHYTSKDITLEKLNFHNGSFFYVHIDQVNLIQSIEPNLLTNFFSFGEMKRNTFNDYINAKFLRNSKHIYLVNRFISSPFFEKTYDSDLNILDYLKIEKYNVNYLDIFPIHHYQVTKRKLFGRADYRPISSPYFEMILQK